MGTETWIISLPLSDSILYLKIIHPPNFREEPKKALEDLRHGETVSLPGKMAKLTALGTRFAPLGLVWKIRKWMKV